MFALIGSPNIYLIKRKSLWICGYVDTAVRRTASDYDLILNSNELLISVLKIESLGLKF